MVWTALYEPWLESRDREIRTKLEKRGVEVHVEHSYLLHRPGMAVNSFFVFAFCKTIIDWLHTVRRVFFQTLCFAIVIVFWLKWTGYLAVAGLNLLAQKSDRISPFGV